MNNEKILLPNGCWCSMPKICPKSAYGRNASTKKDWSIQYRFYDPMVLYDSGPLKGKVKPKQVTLKGMNQYKSVRDRRLYANILIDKELDLLKNGYNLHTGQYINEQQVFYEIDPATPFIKALWKAFDKTTGVTGTRTDIKSVITGVEKAARELRFSEIPISQVSRKYINAILQRCRETNKRFSAHRHNKYRAYLMKLFKQLIQMEAIQVNPMHDVAKMKETKKLRATLTREQRQLVNDHLFKNHYNFWRLLQVFFHSGSRETEIMKVQGKHVDLVNQKCIYTVMKGKEIREVERPIKDIILPTWQELMQNCGPEDYLFSKMLESGAVHIRPDQITRRWRKYVKGPVKDGGLNIQADFYSLKHLNLDETSAQLGMYDASKMASHTSTVVTMDHYLVGEKDRQNERLKKVANSFAG